MRPHTGARADRFSAALARLLTFLAVLLSASGLAAYILRVPLPAPILAAVLLNTAALTVHTVIRCQAPRPDYRTFGGW